MKTEKRQQKAEKMNTARIGINWKVLVVSFLVVFLVAYLGSLFTSTTVNSEWYDSIRPKLTPPSYVFPIVWNILFILIALSLYLLWVKADKNGRKNVAFAFGINFLLNILWSVLYFGLKNPKLAFFELIFLWLSIITMILVAKKIDKKAAWLLVPYLLWVSFASVLNFLSF